MRTVQLSLKTFWPAVCFRSVWRCLKPSLTWKCSLFTLPALACQHSNPMQHFTLKSAAKLHIYQLSVAKVGFVWGGGVSHRLHPVFNEIWLQHCFPGVNYIYNKHGDVSFSSDCMQKAAELFCCLPSSFNLPWMLLFHLSTNIQYSLTFFTHASCATAFWTQGCRHLCHDHSGSLSGLPIIRWSSVTLPY